MQARVPKAPVPPPATDTAAEARLCAMIASGVRARARAAAAARGATPRAPAPGASRDAGVPPGMADADLAGRRAALAAARARPWREHRYAASRKPVADPDAPRGRGRGRGGAGIP